MSVISVFCVGARMGEQGGWESSVTSTPQAGLCQGPMELSPRGFKVFSAVSPQHYQLSYANDSLLHCEPCIPARERSAQHRGCYVQMSISGTFIKAPIFHPRTSFSREVAGLGNHNRDSDRVATVTKPAANILFSTSYGSHTPHKIITFDCFDSSIGKMQTSPVYQFCNGGLRTNKLKFEAIRVVCHY